MIVNIVPFLIKNKTFSDERGSFDKIFQSDDCIFEVKQINISKLRKNDKINSPSINYSPCI